MVSIVVKYMLHFVIDAELLFSIHPIIHKQIAFRIPNVLQFQMIFGMHTILRCQAEISLTEQISHFILFMSQAEDGIVQMVVIQKRSIRRRTNIIATQGHFIRFEFDVRIGFLLQHFSRLSIHLHP